MEDNQLFLFDIDQSEPLPTEVDSTSIACAENTQSPMRDPNVIYSDDSDFVKFIKRTFLYRDGHLHWKHNQSSRARRGDVAGNYEKNGYPKVNITINKKLKKFYCHVLIYKMHFGEYDQNKFLVEHRKGIENGNTIENLRLGTRSQNGSNIPRKRGELHGITFRKDSNKKWKASIRANKKEYARLFYTKEEAIRWRKMMEEKLHGEFKAREVDQAPGQPG